MNIFLNNVLLIFFIQLYTNYYNSKSLTKFQLNLYLSYIISNFFEIEKVNKITHLIFESQQKGFLDLEPSFMNYLSDISKRSEIILPLKRPSPLKMPSLFQSGFQEIKSFYPKNILKVKNEIIIKNNDFAKSQPVLSENEAFIFFTFLIQFLVLILILGPFLKTVNRSLLFENLQNAKIEDLFFYNPYIYSEKVAANKQTSHLLFTCTHYLLNLKKGDFLVLTRNFPEYKLKAGQIAYVTQNLSHQKIEIFFLPDEKFSKKWSPNELKKSNSSFIKYNNYKK